MNKRGEISVGTAVRKWCKNGGQSGWYATITTMTTLPGRAVALLLLAIFVQASSHAVELRVSRDSLERTLKQQLFSAPDGRYYLKGNAQSPCPVYAESANLSFAKDRILVHVKVHAKLGYATGSSCLGIALTPTSEVSLEPYGEGETIGFRNAQVTKVSDRKELNFLLTPFLSRQIPSGMQVNAADLLRKALAGSTATSGYKVNLDQLKIRSVRLEGDSVVVDVDGRISVH